MISYIKIGESAQNDDLVEVPTEADGTLLLSSVCAQFPGSAGLRFKSDTGVWRGLRCSGNIIDPPPDGWGDKNYYVVKQASKRGAVTTSEAPSLKQSKEIEETPESVFLERFHVPDLMIADIPYKAGDEEVREYFEHFGGLDQFSIKRNEKGESRGFGFIKFKTSGATKAVLNMDHFIHNRRLDIRYTKRALEMLQMGYGLECMPNDNMPTKLFVGRMPPNTTNADLQQAFLKYAPLRDIYIPPNSNGRFGFVTFGSVASAFRAMNDVHQIKGTYIQLSTATKNKQEPAGDDAPNNETADVTMDEYNRPSLKVGGTDAKAWRMTTFLMRTMAQMSENQRATHNQKQQNKSGGLSANNMNNVNKSNNQNNIEINHGTNQNSTNNENQNTTNQNNYTNSNYGGGYGNGYSGDYSGGYGGYGDGGYSSSGYGYGNGYGSGGYNSAGYGAGDYGSTGYSYGNGYGQNYNSLGGNPVWGKPKP